MTCSISWRQPTCLLWPSLKWCAGYSLWPLQLQFLGFCFDKYTVVCQARSFQCLGLVPLEPSSVARLIGCYLWTGWSLNEPWRWQEDTAAGAKAAPRLMSAITRRIARRYTHDRRFYHLAHFTGLARSVAGSLLDVCSSVFIPQSQFSQVVVDVLWRRPSLLLIIFVYCKNQQSPNRIQ